MLNSTLGTVFGAVTLLLTGTSIPLVSPLVTLGSAFADEASDLYSQGLKDRTKWENWFSSLSGDKRAGAEYWAGERSLPQPGKCVGTPDFARGCNEAKARLTGPDVLRKSQPAYRQGWNSYVATAAPAQPPAPVPKSSRLAVNAQAQAVVDAQLAGHCKDEAQQMVSNVSTDWGQRSPQGRADFVREKLAACYDLSDAMAAQRAHEATAAKHARGKAEAPALKPTPATAEPPPANPYLAPDGVLLIQVNLVQMQIDCNLQALEVSGGRRVNRSPYCDDPAAKQNIIDNIKKANESLSQKTRNCLSYYQSGSISGGDVMNDCGVREDLVPLAQVYLDALNATHR